MDVISYEHININDNTAVALGKFQGLHKGHMLLIDKIISIAKEENIKSTVFTINMDSEKMFNLPDERFAILQEKGIDYAVECGFSKEFAALTPERFVKEILVDKLHARYVCVGTDFRFGCNRKGDVDRLKSFGIKYNFRVIAFDKLKLNDDVISSSLIRDNLICGNMESIKKLMGRCYSLTGEVRTGKQLGRTIGFPTINIIPDTKKLLPPFGVYETYLYIDGRTYKGVTNIGNNPTVSDGKSTFVETNIIEYDGDLYGRRLTIYFERFLRREIHFKDIDELKTQINKDKQRVIMHQ